MRRVTPPAGVLRLGSQLCPSGRTPARAATQSVCALTIVRAEEEQGKEDPVLPAQTGI